MYMVPSPEQSKIVRVLNLWQKNGVFKIEVIQPLLDMAAGSSSASGPYTGTDETGVCVCVVHACTQNAEVMTCVWTNKCLTL